MDDFLYSKQGAKELQKIMRAVIKNMDYYSRAIVYVELGKLGYTQDLAESITRSLGLEERK